MLRGAADASAAHELPAITLSATSADAKDAAPWRRGGAGALTAPPSAVVLHSVALPIAGLDTAITPAGEPPPGPPRAFPRARHRRRRVDRAPVERRARHTRLGPRRALRGSALPRPPTLSSPR